MSSSSVGTSSFAQVCAHSMGFYSTSSTSSPFDGPVVVDKMGFLQSALRAGGPYLCSLPAHTVHPVIHYDPATTHQIEGYAAQVLRDLHLQYQGIRVVGRHSKVEPEPEQVTTVLVRMPNQPQPELWLRAAKDIHQLLQRHHYDGISVELIETDMFNGIYCLPVESSHFIFPKWENIVHQILAHFPNKDEWVGLDCFRHGTNTNWSSNPVTVIIRVCKTSEKSFDAEARDVHDILVEFGEAGVDVLFMKDATQLYVRAIPLEATAGSVYPGVSIGIHQSSAGCSTLGGFVQLRFEDRTDWNIYALTCFHCVYSPEAHHGDHRIDHPAPQDLRTTIESLNQSIEGLKDDYFYTSKAEIDKGKDGWLSDSARHGHEVTLRWIRRFEKERDACAKMLNNEAYYLGHVFAGSGINRTRLNKDQRRVAVDWALIDMSSNRIKPQMHGDSISGNNGYTSAERVYHHGGADARAGTTLYKSGRSTGETTSVYHGLGSVKLDRLESKDEAGCHPVITWVYKTANAESSFPFAGPGDSGAWITRVDGKVFGILTGGDERQGTTLFCRINDVFDDIKDITGAVEVRIAPAPAPAVP